MAKRGPDCSRYASGFNARVASGGRFDRTAGVVETREGPRTTDDLERVEDPGARCAADNGDAYRLRQVAELEALGLHELVHDVLQRRRLPAVIVELRECTAQRTERLAQLGAQVLARRGGIQLDRVAQAEARALAE